VRSCQLWFQLFIAYVTDYSGGLYCARAEYVGTYTHTINTYTLYFYHFDTPLQTVNRFIPTFIHSFVISFTILTFILDQSDSFTQFIHNFDQLNSFDQFLDQSDSFGHSLILTFIHSIHSSNQFNSSSELRQQRFAHDNPWKYNRGAQIWLIEDYSIHSGKCFGIRSFVRDMLLGIGRGAIHGRRSDMATLGSSIVLRLAQ